MSGMMKYPYQNHGGMMSWKDGPPTQTGGADKRALGSLGDDSLSGPTLVLPAPGAPEPVQGFSCHGSCSGGVGAITDFSSSTIIPGLPDPVVLAGGAYLAYRLFFKKRK